MQYGYVGRWLNSGRKTVGALDLGGASTQITFETPETVENELNSITLRLYGQEYSLYTHSYLCYGKEEALRQILAYLVEVWHYASSQINNTSLYIYVDTILMSVNCFCPVTVYSHLLCFHFSRRVILAKCTIPATRLTSLMSSSWRKCLTRLVQRLRDPNLTTLIPGSGCKAPGITRAALATLLIYFPSSSAPFLSVPLMEFSSPTSAGTSWWEAKTMDKVEYTSLIE